MKTRTAPPAAPPRKRALRVPNPMMFMVWLSIFVPGHLMDSWIERGFAAFMFMAALLTLFAMPAPWETRPASRQASAFFFLIQFFFIASFIYGMGFQGLETGPRDCFEVARYLFQWAFVVYVLRHWDDRVRTATETATTASLYFSLLVAACFLKKIPVLSPFFRDHLYDHTKTFVNYAGNLRLAAPFENPNFLGFYAVQVLTYLLFFSRSPLRLLHIAAAMAVVFFTGSRTAWVTTGLALASAFAVYAYLGLARMRPALVLQTALGAALILGAGFYFSNRILRNNRLQMVLTALRKGGIEREANAAGRLEQNLAVLEFFKRSPVLGMGPSKYATFDYVDNQYLVWCLRNGAVGAMLILSGLGWAALKFVRSQRGDAMSCAGALTLVGVVAVALLTGEFLNNFRLFYLTWFIGAAAARGPAAAPAPGRSAR